MQSWLLLLFGAIVAFEQFDGHALAADAAPKKVVLIAGRKSHGPVGNGIHDYPWSVKLLKVMLDNSNVRDRVRVEYHLDGWPADPKTLEDAETIMIVSDGRDGDLYEEAPHFQNEEQTAAIARQMRRGCGFLTFHFSTFAPDEHAEQILEWSGGYFDWQTDGRREWYSAIQTLDTEVRPATPKHPICRGVEPFRMNEEFYFNIRFRPDDAKLKPILTVPELPGREPDGRVVAWARERPDGGRGFGTTCGHFYENWKNDAFRRTILNALVWTAGAEVPPGGVEARFYTHEEITAALDGVEGTERAVVADTRPVRALILTGAQHPAHEWQDTTPALKDVLERDPRMKVDVSDRIEDLGTPKIREYDLLVLNYCNWQQPGLSDASKTGLVEYLAGGGGLCLIHFANGAFHFSLPGAEESDWPEYRKICRRVWDHTPGKSGHDAHGTFLVELKRGEHPISEGLEAFETTDELYFRQQGDEPIEVLAEARSKVTGEFEPMAFVYEYRKARVFQTVLGHDADAIRTSGTAALIRRAAAWVARREQVPDSELKAAKIPGHWGEDAIGFRWTEEDSVDNRWNRTDVGRFLASIVPLPDEPPVAKGLSIPVGEDQEGAVCFDTQRCALRAAWTGGFLSFDTARYGLIKSPQIAGDLVFSAGERAGWDAADVQYRGLHLHGGRVVLGYDIKGARVFDAPWFESKGELRAFTRTIEVGPADGPLTMRLLETPVPPEIGLAEGVPLARVENGGRMTAVAVSGDADVRLQVEQNAVTVLIPAGGETRRLKLVFWSGAPAQLGDFATLVSASAPPRSLDELREPGSPRWTEPVTTRGALGSDEGPYTVDTLTLPFENPYGALMFVSGHDFLSNGDIALCTVHGDVWIVGGVDDSLETLTWKRFATGLLQPLGLNVVDDLIYVLGRDQITRLHDQNGDREADYYECFSNAHVTSPGGHDYVACLETDPEGNFYFVHATEGVVRVSRDGHTQEAVATGFRNPNGMGVGPDGTITVAPQEGEWTPASCVIEVRDGGHYGYLGPRVTPGRPLGYDPPLCYIPRLQDNSSGGQVWVTSDRWGPLAGQLLHLSYGKCRMMLVLREEVGGHTQGGVVDLPLGFASGVMRGRFSPHDGQLYVSGLKGWASAAAQDGCLQRVRYTGRPVGFPIAVRTMQNGLAITFTRPLDLESAQRPDSYHVQQWNYRYSEGYGSAEYRVSDPQQEGRDDVPVRSATLLNERTVFLEIEGLQPVMQMTIGYTLASDATPIEQTIAYTIHRVGPDSVDPARLVRREVPGRLAADLETRLRPGLLARFEQNGGRDARVSRLAALRVPTGTPAASFLPPGAFTARFEGWVRVPLRGRYTFHFEGNGTASLRINSADVLEGEIGQTLSSPVALHQGYNRLELDYVSLPNGDGSLRLMWGSDSFPIEPVPPTALFCDGADAELLRGEQLRRGRQLAGTHRCFRCHASPAALSERHPAPNLERIAERVERNWLFQWLLDPQHLRNDATMPRLFDQEDPAARHDAADLAAWLTAGSTNSSAEQPSAELAAQGETLYAELGCIGCHRLTHPGDTDEHRRISLFYVGAKYRLGALRAFLRAPHAHYAWSRMPDFQLSETEARALAAWLRTAAPGTMGAADELATADPKRGEQVFRERLCANCHTMGDPHPLQQPLIHNVFGSTQLNGCLAETVDRRARAPELVLSHADRTALVALLGTDGASIARSAPAETSAQPVETLRCSACHNRDGRTSPRQLLTIEETGTGLLPEALPDLTWAGEKLNARWTEQLLKGELSYRPRPWLKARMPASPAYAEQLAAGLAAEHGVDPHEQQSSTIDQRLAELGHGLSLKDALDCRQCHGIGSEEPLGDERTQLAPGINFSHARERLRSDHYRRFVLDPPRYDVGTKMPKLSTDGRTTKVPHILDGDASLQFEALWHYIQSSPAAPLPEASREQETPDPAIHAGPGPPDVTP